MVTRILGRWGLLVLLIGLATGLLGIKSCGPVSPVVVQAINDLSSDDRGVCRRAILTLDHNLTAPNILDAVDPLADIARDVNGWQDVYTRVLAVGVLARIGFNHLDQSEGQSAADVVIELLHDSHSYIVRATCAELLGISNYKPAIPDLEQALTDSQSGVQTQACKALLRMTNFQYSTDACSAH